MGAARIQHARLVKRDGARCHYCKKMTIAKPSKSQEGLRRTRDHVVPKKMGGSGADSNMVIACADCNSEKQSNIYYCGCSQCIGTINRFLITALDGVQGPTKPKVWKHRGEWVLSYGLISEVVPNWRAGMKRVPTNVHA
jgi:hypothetical protein